jgi:hypothetical protein
MTGPKAVSVRARMALRTAASSSVRVVVIVPRRYPVEFRKEETERVLVFERFLCRVLHAVGGGPA